MDEANKLVRYHHIKYKLPTDTFSFTDEFIVTEKIHGSHFAIGYINNTLRLQSRNVIINKDFKQFGLPEIIEPLIQIVEKIKSALNYNFLIYGEIFGKRIFPTMKYHDPTSATVFGSENFFFRAFDLYNVDEKKFWKYSDAVALFEQVGLPFIPILDINEKSISGLYDLVEKYPSAFSKKFVEGFVVKKNQDELSSMRNIFKIVRKDFRVDNVRLLNKNTIKCYANYNRFNSAYSKIGEDWEKVKEEMIRDTLQDVTKVIKDEVIDEIEENFVKFVKKFQKLLEKEKEVN